MNKTNELLQELNTMQTEHIKVLEERINILNDRIDILNHTINMKTKTKNFYSWRLSRYNEKEIIIYRQKQENENSYICIAQIVEQLLKENNIITF